MCIIIINQVQLGGEVLKRIDKEEREKNQEICQKKKKWRLIFSVSFSLQKPTILLAGECTHMNYFSTVHGAYESGQNQARVILDYQKQINHQVDTNQEFKVFISFSFFIFSRSDSSFAIAIEQNGGVEGNCVSCHPFLKFYT